MTRLRVHPYFQCASRTIGTKPELPIGIALAPCPVAVRLEVGLRLPLPAVPPSRPASIDRQELASEVCPAFLRERPRRGR